MPHQRCSRWLSDPGAEESGLPPSSPSSKSSSSSPVARTHHLSSLASKPPSLSHQRHCTNNSTSTSTAASISRAFNACFSGCFGVNNLGMSTLSLMARGGHVHGRPAAAQHDTGKKNGSAYQKRLELEQEVAKLQRELDNEEKVHEVLELALLPRTTKSTLQIPDFLPKKAKELLTELVTVEEEIARLEGEISKIKQALGDKQHAHSQGEAAFEASKLSPYMHVNPSLSSQPNHSLDVHAKSSNNGTIQDKLVLETKPMFFINQAIKGNYTIHDFTSKGKVRSLMETVDKKESQKMVGLQKNSNKSGLIENPFSPKLPPMSPKPKTLKPNPEIAFNFSQEQSISSSAEKGFERWQPNKLSERIIKCLICIFLRVLRTSRATELEKSGILGRSMRSSLNSRGLQLEGSLTSKARLKTQRETSQQDPYGIFEDEASIIRDIGPYKNFVRFTSSSLDSKRFSSSLPLLSKFKVLMNSLHDVDLRFLTHQQKLAFWINMYNICIMNGFLEHGLPSNAESVLTLRNKIVLNIGGNKLNALAIEHFILRQPSFIKEAYFKGDKDDKEDEVRKIYGLDHPEPNITFALCNGSKSSPAVRIYTADSVLVDLEKAKIEYLQASIVVTSSKRLMIPKLLLWNIHDFAKDLESLVDWICSQLPASGSLRKSITECLKAQGDRKILEFVDIMPYDFDFQYLLPI